MGGCDERQQATARRSTARAKDATVNVTFDVGVLLWRRPIVVNLAPDDAMALSIELQKAAIDARQCGYRMNRRPIKTPHNATRA
jgi:hypothetical protein